MMNTLTIFWNEKSTAHFNWWLENSAHSETIESAIPAIESHEILKADLACMAELAQGCRVELVLSSKDVHYNQVNMPNKAQRHLRKAVPYMLEEQLAESVDEMFMAFGSRLPSGEIPVRAIAYEYMQQIQEVFQAAEIKLDRLITDLDLIASSEDSLLVVLHNDQVLVSEPNQANWTCDLEDFSWLVQRQLNEHQEDDEMPIAMPMKVVCKSQEIYQLFEQNLPAGRFAPDSEIVSSIEEYLALSKSSNLNLLQGEFEPKAEQSPLKAMLQKVAMLAAIVLTAHIIYQGSQWFSLTAEKEYLGKQRTALWKQAFPGRKVPANPDKAMRSFLRTLGSDASDTGFLSLLKSATGLMKDLSQLYPTNISYNSSRNELRIDLIAKDLPILNNYRDELKKAGHQVDMTSATQRGEGYTSRLTIRR